MDIEPHFDLEKTCPGLHEAASNFHGKSIVVGCLLKNHLQLFVENVENIPGMTIVGLPILVVRIQLKDASMTESRIIAESLKSLAVFSRSVSRISSSRSPKGGAGVVVDSFAVEGL